MSDDNCLDASNLNGPVKLVRCHGMGGNQAWTYEKVSWIKLNYKNNKATPWHIFSICLRQAKI